MTGRRQALPALVQPQSSVRDCRSTFKRSNDLHVSCVHGKHFRRLCKQILTFAAQKPRPHSRAAAQRFQHAARRAVCRTGDVTPSQRPVRMQNRRENTAFLSMPPRDNDCRAPTAIERAHRVDAQTFAALARAKKFGKKFALPRI
ncbi:MAG: hypothetical protein ACT4QC_21650 [Planctomycetaceae bacterium]